MTTINVTREWIYWISPEPGEWSDLKVRSRSGIVIRPDQLRVNVTIVSSATAPRLASWNWKISGPRKLRDGSLSEVRTEGGKYTMDEVPPWIEALVAECVDAAKAEVARTFTEQES